jgi:diguanylate cyclase (GGDEF)-like protein/PAS domain S-box-containing protein
MRSAHSADDRLVSVALTPEPVVDALRASAERAAQAALRELPEALVLDFDGELRVVRAAGVALERLEDPDCASPGRPLADVLAPEAWRTIEPLAHSALSGETRSRELWTGGRRHCLMLDVGPLRAQDAGAQAGGRHHGAPGEPRGIAVVQDITARRQSELLAAGTRAGRDGWLDRHAIGTGVLDRDGRWLLVNRALCDTTGYTADELLGKRFDRIVHPDDAGNDIEQRRRLLAGEIPAFGVEKRYFDAAGETVSAIVSMSLLRERGGAPLHYVAQLEDVSERRRLEEELRALGDHDPLTGVRNRRLFAHDLKLQVARSRRYGEMAGLMVIEVDPFGAAATLSDRIADEAFEAISRALTRRLRETDLIARLGTDQFAVLLPHVDEEGLAVVVESLERVIAACAVDVGTELLHPMASIGSTVLDERTASAEQALARVERSLRDSRLGRAGAQR